MQNLKLILPAIALFLSSCGLNLERSHQEPAKPSLVKSSLDFESVSAAVFVPHCVRCHVQYGDYRGVKNEIAAIAQAVNSGGMPKGSGPLGADEIRILNNWIAAGFPEKAEGSDDGAKRPLRAEWNSLAENIFIPRCLVCHNPQGTARFLDLSSREAVVGAKDRVFGSGQKLLDIANPEQSYLLAVIQDPDEPMPPKDTKIPQVTQQEVRVISDWISLGLP